MKWLRLYSEFASDPKVQSMDEASQRRLIMIFCLHSENDITTLDEEEIACALRISSEELQKTKQLFIKKGFIDDKWVILNWEKRQFVSDGSKERVKKFRENHKHKLSEDGETLQERYSNGSVTLHNRYSNDDVTPPDTDTDTDTDIKEKLKQKENPPPVAQARPRSDEKTEVLEIFHCWQETLGHPSAKLDGKRRRNIAAALKLGYTAQQLCEAIRGCSLTPHNMGDNDRGQRYDGLNVILRDAEQIERFIGNSHDPPIPKSRAVVGFSQGLGGKNAGNIISGSIMDEVHAARLEAEREHSSGLGNLELGTG